MKTTLKIGTKVRYSYSLPALSCQMNGARVKGRGKIIGKNKDEDGLNYEIKNEAGRIIRMFRSEIIPLPPQGAE